MNIKQVIGIDINPLVQLDEVPENLYLQIDDLNRRYGTLYLFFTVPTCVLISLKGLPSKVATSISSILRWWWLVYMPIDGLTIFEIYSVCFEVVVGVKWLR